MKKIKNNLLALCVGLVALSGLTSCGTGIFDYCPIEGVWTLGQIDGRPVSDEEIVEFTFFSDGTGYYGYYTFDSHHRLEWVTTPIDWEFEYDGYGAEYLYVYPRYSHEVWRYRVDLYSNRMRLYDIDSRQEFMFYDL